MYVGANGRSPTMDSGVRRNDENENKGGGHSPPYSWLWMITMRIDNKDQNKIYKSYKDWASYGWHRDIYAFFPVIGWFIYLITTTEIES